MKIDSNELRIWLKNSHKIEFEDGI